MSDSEDEVEFESADEGEDGKATDSPQKKKVSKKSGNKDSLHEKADTDKKSADPDEKAETSSPEFESKVEKVLKQEDERVTAEMEKMKLENEESQPENVVEESRENESASQRLLDHTEDEEDNSKVSTKL